MSQVTDYRQHCAKRKSAGISFTQRPFLRFFAPQGRHVAPMGVKFGMAEGTERGPTSDHVLDLPKVVICNCRFCNKRMLGMLIKDVMAPRAINHF